jgi:spore germination protein YaaH
MNVPEKDKDGKETTKFTPIPPRTVKKTAGRRVTTLARVGSAIVVNLINVAPYHQRCRGPGPASSGCRETAHQCQPRGSWGHALFHEEA